MGHWRGEDDAHAREGREELSHPPIPESSGTLEYARQGSDKVHLDAR